MENKQQKTPIVALITIFLGYTSLYIDKYIIGITMLPISEALGFDPSQKGLVLSSFFLGYMLLQIPMSYLANRIGSRKVLIIAALMVGIFLLAFGFGFSLLYLVLIRFATGAFGHAGYPTAVSSYLATELPSEKRAPAQSAMIASQGLSAIIGPLLAAPLLAVKGWKNTYYIFGIAVIIVSFIMALTIPKDTGMKIKNDENNQTISFFEIFKDKLVIILVLSAFCLNTIIYGITGWLSSYLVDARGLTLIQASQVSSIGGIFTLLTGLLGGFIVLKFFKDKEVLAIFLSCAIGAGSIYGIYATKSLVLSIVFLCLSNTAVIFSFTTLMSLPHKLFPQKDVATKYAAINAIGVFGGFVAPTIIGHLVKTSNGSYFSAFVFLAATFLLGGIIALFVGKKKVSP